MINDKKAIKVIDEASKTGADFVELYCEDSYKKIIMIENGKVDQIESGNINGVGVRILKELKSKYGYTNDDSETSLCKLAHYLSLNFNDKRIIKCIDKFDTIKHKNFNKKYTSLSKIPLDTKIEFLKKINKQIKDFDPRIVQVKTGLLFESNNITIYNSKGEKHTNNREYARLMISSVAVENGKIETRFDGPGNQGGWEFISEQIDINALCKEHASKLIMMLSAKECPAGKYPVIIGNGWGGVIFHEACGHQLEATSVSKGLSVFSGKLGEKIASDIVSAYDDGTIPNEWGSNIIDDEGNETQKVLLIENGILKGYLVDAFNGRRMNTQPTGCTRRQSYKFEPTSRMSTTYIAPGKSTPEEIIKNTKLGLYAVSFGGGSVNPATGDFNFGCSEAYIVKDGKIVEPVRAATLIGNAKDILKHIDMVGNDLAYGQGNCGSSSGYVPVNVGQPTIRIDEITVGGAGGSIDEYK